VPDKEWHLGKKDSNLKARAQLQQATDQFLDWEITTLFYAALQYVDAFFAEMAKPQHPRKHPVRRRLVARYLRQIAVDYAILNKLSENARYEKFTPQVTDIQAANGHFEKVEAFLQRLVISTRPAQESQQSGIVESA
jgi:hypothetical protein